ncbi:uncharacterized protein LOC143055858 isoform X2 [Mytilus galloprovincialis]|uniref:uncharacterized protein LOC143055858 isoform X2 n=1 Tax=Mytilus galloprovincialis TaxID=29158 RepID=UPI003F7C13EB
MVYCVAFNCKTGSGQGIGLFEFPKDDHRRKQWTIKVKRKNFQPSNTSRLCAKRFSNDQFVVNPLFAASIGYKMKKLQLKSDAVPTIFDFSSPKKLQNTTLTVSAEEKKRKHVRQSGAVRKRKRIEALNKILEIVHVQASPEADSDIHVQESPEADSDHSDIHGSNEHDECYEQESKDKCFDKVTSDKEEAIYTAVAIPMEPQRYNAYIQTVQVEKNHFSCQTDMRCVHTTDAAVQTDTVQPSRALRYSQTPEMTDEDHDTCSNESDEDWVPYEEEGFSDEEMDINEDILINEEHDKNEEPHTNPPFKKRKFMVFESNLKELLQSVCLHCVSTKEIDTFNVIGTAVTVNLKCKCPEITRWNSQPFSGTMPLGNLILAGAVLFSGGSISKILTFFRHASVCCFSERTFSSLQNAYLLPTITDIWQCKQLDLITEIQNNGSPVKIGGDARCCTPGHTAKYGSYSIMDLERSKIIDMQLVQSNEVPNSYHMELEGLKRCLAYLDGNDIQVLNFVTDRHPSIKKYMRLERENVHHMFDVWHVAKGVFKKLDALGKRKTKGFDVIGRWAKSISNHIYWCAASSQGDGEMVTQKWSSILNHITNIHEGHGPKFPACLHDTLDDREWIKKDSKVYQAIEKIAQERTLMKDIGKLSPAEQTSSLESYHRVVCFFAPKSVHFMHAQMEARLCSRTIPGSAVQKGASKELQ